MMFRAAILRSLCLALLCGAASLAVAQDFSAEVFTVNGQDAKKSANVSVKGSKMRVGRGDTTAEQSAPIMLVDTDTHAATIFDAANHTYMKADVGPEQGLSFFRLKTPSDACKDFEKVVGVGGCKKAGNEAVGGRQTVKYVGKSDGEKPVAMWVDPELNFVVKWQMKSGEVGELRNIKVAPQSDSLFAIPAGFRDAAEGNATSSDTKDTNKDDPGKEEPSTTPQ